MAIAEAIRAKQQRAFDDLMKVSVKSRKGPSSEQRQSFLNDLKAVDRQKMLLTMSCLAKATDVLTASFACQNHRSYWQLFPRCSIRLIQRLKRVRLELSRCWSQPPSPDELYKDKLLGLFTDDHLRFASLRTTPVVFLAREAVSYVHADEDCCYFIRRGIVDVCVGASVMARLDSGSVVGAMGMLANEPRTATLIARSTVYAWKLSRSDFNEFPNRYQMNKAMEMVLKQRQTNIRNEFKSELDINFISTMFGLQGWPTAALDELMTEESPVVIRNEEVVMDCTDNTMEESVFVLRGKVQFLVRGSPDMSDDPFGARSLEQSLTLVCGFPKRPQTTLNVHTISHEHHEEVQSARLFRLIPRHLQSVRSDSSGELWTVVGEATGPMLLNVAASILGESSQLRIVASSKCDALKFYPLRAFKQKLSALDQTRIKFDLLQPLTKFVAPLPSESIRTATIPKALFFSFFSLFPFESIPFTPVMLDSGNQLVFNAAHHGSADFFIVASENFDDEAGVKLDTDGQGGNGWVMWPALPHVFFGAPVDTVIRAKVRTAVYRCPRGALINLMVSFLAVDDLKTVVQALGSLLQRVSSGGYIPCGNAEADAKIQRHLFSVSKQPLMAERVLSPLLMSISDASFLSSGVLNTMTVPSTTGHNNDEFEASQLFSPRALIDDADCSDVALSPSPPSGLDERPIHSFTRFPIRNEASIEEKLTIGGAIAASRFVTKLRKLQSAR